MSNWIRRLKVGLGPLGFVADLLTVALANWGVIVAALVAFGATFTKSLFQLVSDPHVESLGKVFLWSLWTYIALSILYRLHVGIKTSPRVDYSHCIIVEALTIAYDGESEEHTLQLGVNLRNVGSGPIKIQVHDLRIIIEGRTIPDSPMLEMIVPRIGSKGIMSGNFKKDVVKDRGEGTIDLVLHYGDPDGEPSRKYRLKSKIFIKVGDQPSLGNQVTSEEDSPL